MSIKWIGGIFVFFGCGSCGFLVASQYLQRIRMLRQLNTSLEYMVCELKYRCTSLPQLCGQAGELGNGKIFCVFLSLGKELEAQICPNVDLCMKATLAKFRDLPQEMRYLMGMLGQSLGKFDLDGQITGLQSVQANCQRKLDELMCEKDNKIRSYQTLGLCAGAALAILFV